MLPISRLTKDQSLTESKTWTENKKRSNGISKHLVLCTKALT